MNVRTEKFRDVLIIEPRVFEDPRGLFFEVWQQKRYAEAGVPTEFVQDNLSVSSKGVVRGLHLQFPRGQGKLVGVLQGEIYDVMVDVRVGSPSFGKWFGITLSEKNFRQVYIPPGYAHGFYTLSERAVLLYKCTDFYDKASEITIAWDDPEIGIAWPSTQASLSEKDAGGIRLSAFPRQRLPPFL